MEVNDMIVGAKLNEIQKKPDEVKLFFENSKTHKIYILTFKGLLFETSASTLNRRVKNIELNNTLGFRATSQLRKLKRNPDNYRQLFIQMEGSSDDNKIELLGALRNYKISPKRQPAAAQNKINAIAPTKVAGRNSNLNARILRLINEYSKLQDNWDEDDAKAPSGNAIINARCITTLLNKLGQPVFHAAPGPNGEIMLDIRNANRTKSIEVIFYEKKSVVVLFSEQEKPIQKEFETSDLPELLEWLNQK